MRTPSVVENLRKQEFNLVPTASLDEARTWLADELSNWKTITHDLKIELQN
jgi:hypothetical protein